MSTTTEGTSGGSYTDGSEYTYIRYGQEGESGGGLPGENTSFMENLDGKGSGSGTIGTGLSTNTHVTSGAGYIGSSEYTHIENG